MKIRRPRRTPSTRGGRVTGTPRARRRIGPTRPSDAFETAIKKFRSDRAGKARSTPTPKAPTRKRRPPTSPTRSTPTSVRKSRRPTVRVRNPMGRR